MVRKNHSRAAEASSSAIHFDASTKTVMAEATQENIKEKVLAVREVVPGKSTNDIILVLQYYDYDVERTIQAYLEDGAKEALQEWSFTGKQPAKKKKNKKKGGGSSSNASGDKTETPTSSSSASSVLSTATTSTAVADGGSSQDDSTYVNGLSEQHQPNGDMDHHEHEEPSSTHLLSDNTQAAASGALPQRQRKGHSGNHRQGHNQRTSQQDDRERTTSEVSVASSIGEPSHKKPFHGLEKAIKDLHRQTTSLERLRIVLDHEIDRSYRSVKSVFEELRQGLNTREAKLFEEMDQLKREASAMLEQRQGKAVELKRQVDRSERMSDTEVNELRAEVKHFVSERRHDEELGRTTRFLYDSDGLLDEINKFGEVVHVQSAYTVRRGSTSSVASSVVSQDGNQDVDNSSGSQEVNELQDRLKNSLKLQSVTVSVSQNGPSGGDYIPSKNNRRQAGNSDRSYRSESSHNDVTAYPTPSSDLNQSDNYYTNTGSPGRGRGYIGGRGRAGRGGRGSNRGGSYRVGPRPQSSHNGGQGSRPPSGSSSANRNVTVTVST